MHSASGKIPPDVSDECVRDRIRRIGRDIHAAPQVQDTRRRVGLFPSVDRGARRTPRKCKWGPSVGVGSWYDTCQMWKLNGRAREWDLINGRGRPCTLMNFPLADVGLGAKGAYSARDYWTTDAIKRQISHSHYLSQKSNSEFLPFPRLIRCGRKISRFFLLNFETKIIIVSI